MENCWDSGFPGSCRKGVDKDEDDLCGGKETWKCEGPPTQAGRLGLDMASPLDLKSSAQSPCRATNCKGPHTTKVGLGRDYNVVGASEALACFVSGQRLPSVWAHPNALPQCHVSQVEFGMLLSGKGVVAELRNADSI